MRGAHARVGPYWGNQATSDYAPTWKTYAHNSAAARLAAEKQIPHRKQAALNNYFPMPLDIYSHRSICVSSNLKEGTMSTAFPHCRLESKARAGRVNAPAVPGASPRTLRHYGRSAPAEPHPGCPQGARARSPADQRQETAMDASGPRLGRGLSIRSVRRGAAQILAPWKPGFRSFLERSFPPPETHNRASPPPLLLRPP